MWSDVEVSISNVLLTQRSGLFPYQSYINKAFLSSKEAVEMRNISEVVFFDTAGRHSSTDPKVNTGFGNRKTLFDLSQKRTIITPLTDIAVFNQSKYFPPNISIIIVSSSTFVHLHHHHHHHHNANISDVTSCT